MSVNKAILVGRIGKDPEDHETSAGKKVTRLSIATSENWKDKDGVKQERTEWHRVICWDKLAEVCMKYVRKGDQVYVEGKIQTRSWEKDGEKKYATEIIATNITFLTKKEQKSDQEVGF